MNRKPSRTRGCPLRRLLPVLLLAVAGAAAAAPADLQDRAQLERQLDAARGRLDDAARDVAELSGKLYGDEAKGAMPPPHGGPARGAMLGVNIGGEQDRTEGVEVKGVSPGGPAEAAGLRTGDVIVAVDGRALRKTADQAPGRQLVEYLRDVQPGQVVRLEYLRAGRKGTASVKTSAAEPPFARVFREHLPMLDGMQMPDFERFLGGPGRGFRSLELVPVTPQLGRYFGTDTGLLVVRAPADAGAKLEEGDVILTIGGRTPENPRHAFRILGSYQPGEKVRVEVLRQRKRVPVEITVPQAPPGGPTFDAPRPRQPVPPLPPSPRGPEGGPVSS